MGKKIKVAKVNKKDKNKSESEKDSDTFTLSEISSEEQNTNDTTESDKDRNRKKDKERGIYQDYTTKLEPIKILFKYKNNNDKYCYHVYIFVGNHAKKYKKIFDKMKDLSIRDTLKELSQKEQKILEEEYGEFWLMYFFNIQHITYFISKLKKDKKLYEEIKNVTNDGWLDKFINKFQTDIISKKVNYSYAEKVKHEYMASMGKKIELLDTKEFESVLPQSNFTQNILYEASDLLGGNKNNIGQNGGVDDEDDMNDDFGMFEDDMNEVEEEIKYEETIESMQENVTLDELIKLYQTEEIDENIKKTNEMIAKALDNEKIVIKKGDTLVKFDKSHVDDVYGQELKDVVEKKFVYEHFIYKDDNIKTIKNKITVSIKNRDDYSTQPYILPSRMYLWTEYIIDKKIDKVMLGTKWLRKNNIFDIPIEPLEMKIYKNREEPIKRISNEMQLLGSRIKPENEENNILYEYDEFMINNEIFMVDIYNEIGLKSNLSDEHKKNITDTYIKLYFSHIKPEDVKLIFDYTSGDTVDENKIIKDTFDTIYNDLLLEKEICSLVDEVRIENNKEYKELFKLGNAITLSDINIHLKIDDEQLYKEYEHDPDHIHIPKLDLFRIFNDFSLSERFPFLQYHMSNEQIIIKYDEDYMIEFSKSKENLEIMTKWFEHAGYGLSFKIKIKGDKFMSININEIGKIDYKTQWKEDDMANIQDVYETYNYVRDLVKLINKILRNHPRKVTIKEPEDWEFKFAFINGIQRFTLPTEKQINHNDLSDFCVFFYPYVSVIVEPAKRIGKSTKLKEETGKFGTYLKYKRIPRYDNTINLEKKIFSYLKNYDISEDTLIDQISKQFNITSDAAKLEIEKVKNKLGEIEKTPRKLKTIDEHAPRMRGQGRSIDIQGKTVDKYKIRISGARDQRELERTIEFLNILLFLYYETYILKKPERQDIKDKLKKITNIARRRSKVSEFVDYKKEQSDVKKLKQLDKKRLASKGEDGTDWVRACQNSGKDKRRRPEGFNVKQIQDKGYKLNKKTGEYEKEVYLTKTSKTPLTLSALKVASKDDNGDTKEIYYTCDPTENGEHMYVGFLTKSVSAYGMCLPCCFKKNIMETKNKDKQQFFSKCKATETVEDDTKKEIIEEKPQTSTGDILYVLLDSVKVPEGRISYLPKLVDIFINQTANKTKKIKNNYLSTSDGYFFKGGIKQDDYCFLDTLSYVLQLSSGEIKMRIKQFLKNDKEETYYTRLNSGDIRDEYRIGDFIKFIESTDKIDYFYLKDILQIENLFTERGILPIVFYRENITVKSNHQDGSVRESTGVDLKREDFYIEIDNNIVTEFEYYKKILKEKDLLLLIHDGKYYYPIIKIDKKETSSKTITITKLFNKDSKEDNLIQQINKLFEKTIQDITIDKIKTHMSAHEIMYELKTIDKDKYKIKAQVIDARYKCRYLVLENDCIVPVNPSSVIENVPMICMGVGDSQHCLSKLELIDYKTMCKLLEELVKDSDNKLNIMPIGLFYSEKDGDKITLSGIMTSNNDIVPIRTNKIDSNEINKKYKLEDRPLYQELDQKILSFNKTNIGKIDKRVKEVNEQKYKEEAYQLFRYELSNILNRKQFKEHKTKIIKYIENENSEKIYKIIKELCSNKITEGGVIGPELVKIVDMIPDTTYYRKQNNRIICEEQKKDTCSIHPHCIVVNEKCKIRLTQDFLNEFIDKLVKEISNNEMKKYEILQLNNNYVDDIVDHNYFTERKGQKIIKSTHANLTKKLEEIFGKEDIPKIGKRYKKRLDIDLQQLYLENPLRDIKIAYTQSVIQNNWSILRGYANCYYWIRHNLYDTISRNLGFYSEIQNEMVKLFSSRIIDWLNIPTNIDRLIDAKLGDIIYNKIASMNKNNINKNLINTFIIDLIEKTRDSDFGFLELLILNDIHKIPITISLNNNPKYHINNLNITIIKSSDDQSKFLNKDSICLNYKCDIDNRVVMNVEVSYYKN